MRKQERDTDHLLDYLAQQVGCIYLSNLRMPDSACRDGLRAAVGALDAGDATRREWNEALAYLYNAPAEMTADRSRARLLALPQENRQAKER